HSRHKRQLEHHMENLTGGTPPVRYLPCVVPCKLYFEAIITIESEKPYTEMDSGLIAECVDWLYEILELPRLTQEQIDENIKKIFCEAEKRKKNTEF
ncbi:MAG: hypothetical protein U0M02_07345, partial [Acutalibacteraceae bacterium]|nr:hypothetical protein [Acutalibacteraceae bacterium]